MSFLETHGIRPTKQRLEISSYLFDGGHRHVTAEQLMAIMKKRRGRVSLATIYNSLQRFVSAGLLRKIELGDSCRYYDTNLESHGHFYDVDQGRLWDMEEENVSIEVGSDLPDGMKVDRVEAVVFVKRKA